MENQKPVKYSELDHKLIEVRCYLACFDKEIIPDGVIIECLKARSVQGTIDYLLEVLRGPAESN